MVTIINTIMFEKNLLNLNHFHRCNPPRELSLKFQVLQNSERHSTVLETIELANRGLLQNLFPDFDYWRHVLNC